ncbi:FAS1 domain-containing protein [Basidiobolus meristosporus CBS 931.73]|uniref:FAS1 domain-containing protein n=1 Tax=Basidiobolus meristosporus CBS 931.73 TaxID=1314790 RepID=A0A1Y1ZDG7_9FUNG|nr:FAS1 domain-containing protein [Basidiobolus meristosporus CBS 931.73]|eukprot:ORY08246.1 FAS1 domain-containing protein [Basidiobolus meristosporus CBS 931.73]
MSLSRALFDGPVGREQDKEEPVASTSATNNGNIVNEEETLKQTRGYNKASSVFEVLELDGRFSRFLKTLSSSSGNLQNDLSNPRNPLTIFAPTDDAFAEFTERYELPPDELQKVLNYHIIPDIIDEEDIQGSDAVATSYVTPKLLNEPQRILIERKGSRLYLNNGIKVSEANIEAKNGIVHVIRDVINLPKNILTQLNRYSEFSIFLKAIETSGLEKEFNEPGLTVFVPNNFAFKSLGHAALDYLLSPEGRKDLRFVLLNHISPELIYAGDLKLPADDRDARESRPRQDDGFNDRLPNHRGNNGNRDWDTDLTDRPYRHDRRGKEESKSSSQAGKSIGTVDGERLDRSNRTVKNAGYVDEPYDVYTVDYPSWVHGERLSLRILTDYKSSIDITINRQARVIIADGIAENGVIHVIDRVLLPPDLILPQLQWHEFDREQRY